MRSPSSKIVRISAAAATPIAVIAAAALIWQSSYAAFTGSTRNSGNEWSTGSVALTDDDAGSARFQVTDMIPEDTQTRCITVTANATNPGTVKGYAVNPVTSNIGLEDHIFITVNAGTGGGFGSCTGFTSEEEVIPHMSLRQLAGFDSYADAAGGWDVPEGTSSRTYEITWKFETTGMAQNEIDELQGSRTGIDFQWELQSN